MNDLFGTTKCRYYRHVPQVALQYWPKSNIYVAFFLINSNSKLLISCLHTLDLLKHICNINLFVVELTPSLMAAKVELAASLLSLGSCVWLAYILFVVLQDICVVCCSMYIVNTYLFVGSILRYNSMVSGKEKKKRQ